VAWAQLTVVVWLLPGASRLGRRAGARVVGWGHPLQRVRVVGRHPVHPV